MHLIRTLLLSAVITLVTLTAFAVEINTNGSFGFAEGSLSGLQGVGFSGNFNYDTSGVLASYHFGPHLGVHELGVPAGGQLIVHGLPQFSFSFHGLGIWVENDHVFDGFGVIPAGMVDNYFLTGFAPGANYNLSSHSIIDGFVVSLGYIGTTAMLSNTALLNDLPALDSANSYDPIVVLDEYKSGKTVGTAIWSFAERLNVSEPASFMLLLMVLFGIFIRIQRHCINRYL